MSQQLVYSFDDVAQRVSTRYDELKILYPKVKLCIIFDHVCKEEFENWKEKFGYQRYGTFKGDISHTLSILRKKSPSIQPNPVSVVIPIFKNPGEGSTLFTTFQIQDLGLNPESY